MEVVLKLRFKIRICLDLFLADILHTELLGTSRLNHKKNARFTDSNNLRKNTVQQSEATCIRFVICIVLSRIVISSQSVCFPSTSIVHAEKQSEHETPSLLSGTLSYFLASPSDFPAILSHFPTFFPWKRSPAPAIISCYNLPSTGSRTLTFASRCFPSCSRPSH